MKWWKAFRNSMTAANTLQITVKCTAILYSFLYSRKPVCRTGQRTHANLSHSPSSTDKFIDYSSWIIKVLLDVLVCSIAFYYIDTSVLLENTPLAKFIRNHIRDSSGVFSISSLVKISMISLISSLSLKLYLNSLVYHRNIFGSSSKVLGNLRSSIFGNFRKMFGNVRVTFGQVLENLRKSSESGRKSSENRQKRRHQYVYIIKRTLHVSSKIWILCSRGKNNISLVRCAHLWDIALATRT